jgi:uncharacterized membrane protein
MNHDPQRPKPAARAAPPSLTRLPGFLGRVLQKYPSLVRHPHAFAVHFPIVFLYSAAVFSLAYLLTGVDALELSAFHFLAAGVLFLPASIVTGEISRRVSYSKEPVQAFRIEIYYSGILLLLGLAALLWRWLDPRILRNFRWESLLYLVIMLALPTLVTIISFFGGLLTFPLNNNEKS